MKKALLFTLVLNFSFIISGSWAWAQGVSEESEFTLEEITVTAEKRSETLQKIPGSVVAFEGIELAQQGKLTTQQILESIPNVKWEGGFANVGVTDSAPDAGIAIRGVRFKQTSDGQPPAATATYVDGVFQGYGGNFDIDRVEVLRGPQGTLYGRSATAGVVNFITRNPELSEFGGDVSLEIGEASLKNIQAAVNAPIGEKVAIRAAAHFLERDGYNENPDGGYYGVREGRIKALFQPTDALDITLNATINETKTNSGGYAARLTSPDTIDFKDTEADVVEGVWRRGTMYSLTANYDFDEIILTYIGSYRHYEDTESEPEVVIRAGSQIMHNQFFNYGETFKTHELRLTSDWDEWWNWLVGAFYYNSDYDRLQQSVNHRVWISDLGIEDPDPNTQDAPIFAQPVNGKITNIGVFTEETFDFQEDMRLTLGLRYDKTKNDAYSAFNMNVNENEYRHALNPPTWQFLGYSKVLKWNNITYKVRFEYDLTPDNMLYILTATGFQPGDIRISNTMGESGMILFPLDYDEEKLTSYEVGSKNRFLDNTLQLNVSAFYYDYSGYRHTVNTALSGPPVYTIITTPLRMIGAELETEWIVTALDKVSFDAAFLDAEITELPDMPAEFTYPTEHYIADTDVSGIPPFTATLAYDHVFGLGNGSTFVPRAEIRYTSGMYVNTEPMTQDQVDAGVRPYAHQDGYVVADIGATWTSASEKYSATAYVRNIFDEEYKRAVQVSGGISAVGVNAGDPRVWGLIFNLKF